MSCTERGLFKPHGVSRHNMQCSDAAAIDSKATCMMCAWLLGNSAQMFRSSFSASVCAPRSGCGMGGASADRDSRMEAMVATSSPVTSLLK